MAPAPLSQRPRSLRGGVTAMESMLAMAIVTIAGTALLSALGSAVMSSREIALMTVAQGLADQLLAEATACPVPAGAAPAKPAPPRSNFTVVDHYDGWDETPPQDRLGRRLGTEGTNWAGSPVPRPAEMQADLALLSRFGRSVTVEKVALSGSNWVGTSSDTRFRRITVRVRFADDGRTRPLAEASRVVGYVEPSL